ncbi:MAG: phosphoribosylanthranilate isomerase [Oscillospiraceae bacterium]
MRLKLCGLRRMEDIALVNAALPDYAGFILAPSKRWVSVAQLEALTGRLDWRIVRVGVFVNAPLPEIVQALPFIDIVQLHGDEDADYFAALRSLTDKELWKAVRVRTAADIEAAQALPCAKLLLDGFSVAGYGGTGKPADFTAIEAADITKPFFLAGGLNAENLTAAARRLQPFGLDLSSGIETDGRKDEAKINAVMREFSLLRD